MKLNQSQYLALTTFRKSGQGVSTAMWFAIEGDRIYMQTNAASWKVKRIANSARVQVCPSDSRGKPLGEMVEGTATLHPPKSAVEARSIELLTKHYGWIFRLFNFGLWLFRRKLVYIEVQLQGSPVNS